MGVFYINNDARINVRTSIFIFFMMCVRIWLTKWDIVGIYNKARECLKTKLKKILEILCQDSDEEII